MQVEAEIISFFRPITPMSSKESLMTGTFASTACGKTRLSLSLVQEKHPLTCMLKGSCMFLNYMNEIKKQKN